MAQSLELEGVTELTLRNAGDGRLFAIIDGEGVSVRLRQCFPWSEPHRHLSLRDEDDEEVALVDDPATLAPESRHALEQALAEAGFVLEVTRVLSIDEEVVSVVEGDVEALLGQRPQFAALEAGAAERETQVPGGTAQPAVVPRPRSDPLADRRHPGDDRGGVVPGARWHQHDGNHREYGRPTHAGR